MDSTDKLGSAAAELYHMVTEQELAEPLRAALEDMLALGPDGRWATPEYRASAPGRALLEARALAALFLLDEDVVWSSHRASSTEEAFRRFRALIEGAQELQLQVRRISAANGDQGIELRNGRRLRFVTRTRHGGRGLSTDCYLVDECLDDPGEWRPNVMPSMATRPNPQLVIAA